MRNDFEEDQGQFKMQPMEDLEDASLNVNVAELRLEKISQRVTFISILIPVLIIIVLVFAYLDIKKRMTYTEDTGTMEFEKLSTDLESRFSSLSLRQAKLEESLVRFSNGYDQSLAGINIKLDKINKTFGVLDKKYLTQHDLTPVREALSRNINEVADSIDQVDKQISSMTQELKTQIVGIGASISTNGQELEQLKKNIRELDSQKIDGPEVDLKIKLASLKIEQDLALQIEKLKSDFQTLSNTVRQLQNNPPPPAPSISPTSNAHKNGGEEGKKSSEKIEEQPIKP